MKILIDTGFWLALYSDHDLQHEIAREQYNFLVTHRAVLFTSEYVLVETYTRLIYDIHLQAAENLYKNIALSVKKQQLTILESDEQDREEVWKMLSKYRDHKLSFTDAMLVVFYDRYKFDFVFTFDKHFRNIGLPTNEM